LIAHLNQKTTAGPYNAHIKTEDVAANSCARVLENENEIEMATGRVPDKDCLLPLSVLNDTKKVERPMIR